MKHLPVFLSGFLAVLSLCGCSECSRTPRAKHVIFLGFDAMSAAGIQRAKTPNFNDMIEHGAVSLDTRCVRETSSSQNWMSMLSGTPVEMHGVLDNDWEYETRSIEPAVRNAAGMFPTVFDWFKEQNPKGKLYGFYEWTGQERMYDTTRFDKIVKGEDAETLLKKAFEAYLSDEPELLYISIDITDHVGHTYGHESQEYFNTVTRMDQLVGEFIKELKSRDMLKDAVIIITADHGGIRFGHGGDTMAELQIPVILYGKGVTEGKLMEHANMIYDNAATIAGLLGVKMPPECRGRFMKEAFEPRTAAKYVPVPLVYPFTGVVREDEKVSITADLEGAEIYYTLDGTIPDEHSTKYDGPFPLPVSGFVNAVACKDGQHSAMASNFLYASQSAEEAAIGYKIYRNYFGEMLPDFTKFGRADASGHVSAFSLDGLPVTADDDDFAVIFTTCLVIRKSGTYVFEVSSDDGSKLYIDETLVVNNDGSHSLNTKKGCIRLSEGRHILKVEYFEDHGGQALEVRFAENGSTPHPFFPGDLTR